MCSCITFCWTRQLSNSTLTDPVTFGVQELCVLVLYSSGPDSYLTLPLIGPVAFGGRELCVLVLYSAGSDSFLALL
jgi:hypothetical protein